MMKETMLRKSTATYFLVESFVHPAIFTGHFMPIDPSLTEAGSSLPNVTGHDRRDISPAEQKFAQFTLSAISRADRKAGRISSSFGLPVKEVGTGDSSSSAQWPYVNRTPGTGVGPDDLISEVALVADSCSATLALNPNDRYFFDHPLDHVPGMALVTGLLDLVRASGPGDVDQDGLRIDLSLALPRFCELEPVTRLEATAPGDSPMAGLDGTVSVRAAQDGRLVCDGSVSIHRGRRPAAGPATRPRTVSSPSGRLSCTGNAGRTSSSATWLLTTRADGTVGRPPAGHVLAARTGQAIRPEVVVDAARQFGTLICHQEHHAPMDTQLVLLSVEADIPCDLRQRVYLRWPRTPDSPGRRAAIALKVLAGDPGRRALRASPSNTSGATPATYRRLRFRKAAACDARTAA